MKSICMLMLLLTGSTITSMAQKAEDTSDGRFHDDLFNHLVGNWDGASVAHGNDFTLSYEAEWIMNHQYLNIHFKSHEIVPWIGVPFEASIFFGYNHADKRYTTHAVTVHGDEAPFEGFCYGYRTGNEFKIVAKANADSAVVQRFTWTPASDTWRIESRWDVKGKEGEPFLEINLVRAKPKKTKDN